MKVILIEDNKQDFKKFSDWLMNASYETISFIESKTLIDDLRNSKNRTNTFKNWFKNISNNQYVVAFILDIHLKLDDFNGLDIKDLIRRDALFAITQNNNFSKIPIFILTSDRTKDKEAHSKGTEADRYILKSEAYEDTFINKLELEINKYPTNISMKEEFLELILQELLKIKKEVTKDNIDKLLESIQGLSGVPIKSFQDILQLGNEPLLKLFVNYQNKNLGK